MKRLALGALCLCAGYSAQASAADIGDPVSDSSWKFYVGVQAGGASADVAMTEYDAGTSDKSGYTLDLDTSGFIGGIYAGANYVTSHGLLIGAEADLSYSGLGDENYLDDDGETDKDYLYGWDSGLQGSLRARLGIVAGDMTFYGTGGLAMGQNTFNVYGAGVDNNPESFDETMVGWTLGGGFEYAFASNWSGRIEYRYTDFGDVTITPTVAGYGGDYDDELEVTQQTLTVGVSYAF